MSKKRTISAIAHAKLKLYLDITGRRSDGYHELETVMQSISLGDLVTVDLSGGTGITISCDKPDIPADECNLAYKAAQLFLDETGERVKLHIDIKKRIPSGAGMGGGSADAAAVLAILDKAYPEKVSRERLFELATELGADVPFCLAGGTKICKGIGEKMSDTEPFSGYYLVIMPDFTCPTGEAYKRYDNSPIAPKGRLDGFISAAAKGEFYTELYNVFEVLYADERIEGIKARLLESGAKAAMMTGSGAAVFGVFENIQSAVNAAADFPTSFVGTFCTSDDGIEFRKEYRPNIH